MRRLLLLLLAAPGLARAVPGPDSVCVIANRNDPESVALAERYREARGVPRAQVCALDLPPGPDLTLADYHGRFLGPLESCLGDAGVLARMEAALLIRGVPLRVRIPGPAGEQRASLAAVLGAWRSTGGGRSVLEQAPGSPANCGGTPCTAARWTNLYRSGAFEPGFRAVMGGLVHEPLLVTMLHGRSASAAAGLLDSALAAEAAGGARGQFVFMRGADPARGVLDPTYPAVIGELARRGFTDAVELPFDADRRDLAPAALFVGTAGLGATIESSRFQAGALVDNVTSFGAVPENFAPSGEVQVSIARFVAAGAAGVHGTTDEPLNNCFPSRELILAWVDGYTLAEAYLRSLPFFYWQNLVLGDPLAAPYAARPVVELRGLAPGERPLGARRLTLRATDPRGRPLSALRFYVNGEEVAASGGDPIEDCFALPPGPAVHLLAVAQVAEEPRTKGWTTLELEVLPGPTSCEVPDAGVAPEAGAADRPVPEAGMAETGPADAGTGGSPEAAGCACRTAGPAGALELPALLAALRCLRRRMLSKRP